MVDRNLLNFNAQAQQLLQIIEPRLKKGQKEAVIQLIELKFKSLYEQGIIGGRRYEKEGVYPYMPLD